MSSCTLLWRHPCCAPAADPWVHAVTHPTVRCTGNVGASIAQILRAHRWTPAGGRYRPIRHFFTGCGHERRFTQFPRQFQRRARHRAPPAPLHQLQEARADRPAHHRARPRHLRHRRRRQGIHRGHGRPVVGGAGLQQRAAGDGGLRADEAAAVLPRLQPASATSRRSTSPRSSRRWRRSRCRRCSSPTPAPRPTTPSSKMVWYINNALGRPPKKKIVSRLKGYHGITVASGSLTGLPNNHRSFDLPIAGVVHTADAALLPRRQGRRERGAVRDALRRGARAADRQGRRRRPGRGHDLRAGDGRGRRDRAAQGLLREDPGGRARSTTCCSSPTR